MTTADTLTAPQIIKAVVNLLTSDPTREIAVPMAGRTLKTFQNAQSALRKTQSWGFQLHFHYRSGDEVMIISRQPLLNAPRVNIPKPQATIPAELVYKPEYRVHTGDTMLVFKTAWDALLVEARPLGGTGYLGFVLGVSPHSMTDYRRNYSFSFAAACKLDNITGMREKGLGFSQLCPKVVNPPPLSERAKHIPRMPISNLRIEIQELVKTTHRAYAPVLTSADNAFLTGRF